MPSLTIQGAQFTVPDAVVAKYDHFLTSDAPEGLRHTVRQTLLENLRNNFAGKVKEALDGTEELPAEKVTELQTAFDEYANGYEFGIRSAGGGGAPKKDPVEREMHKLAREDLKVRYKASKNETAPKDWLDEMTPVLVEKDHDGYAKRARAIMRQRTAGTDALAELGL